MHLPVIWFSSHPSSNCLQSDGECLSGSHLLHYKFSSLSVTFHELTHSDLPVQLHFSSLSHTLQPDLVARRSCTKPCTFPFHYFAPAILSIRDARPLWLSLSLTLHAQLEHCFQVSSPASSPHPQQAPRRLGPMLPRHSGLTSSPAPLTACLCGACWPLSCTISVAYIMDLRIPILRVLGTRRYAYRFAVTRWMDESCKFLKEWFRCPA